MPWRSLIVVAALAGVAAAAPGELDRLVADQLEVADRTGEILRDKRQLRAGELRVRARAAYKLLRAGHAPLWVDPEARAVSARHRAAARRILRRDVREVDLLVDELAAVDDTRARLAIEREALAALTMPEGRLARPVPGRIRRSFGEHRDRATGATLRRQGVELQASPGDPVRAPVTGEVTFAGALRGLGTAVVVATRDGPVVVVGGLRAAAVTRGQKVERGHEIGTAAGRVHLELRVLLGQSSYPIDPAPLLEP